MGGALSGSLAATADERLGDVAALLEHAVELAARTVEGNAYDTGPTTAGRHDDAVRTLAILGR